TADAVVAQANQSLADFQRIRCWFAWPDEDFPRTSTQKPKLAVIREAAESRLNGRKTTGAASGTLQEVIQSVARRPVEIRSGANLEDDLNLNSLDRVEL